MGETIIQSMTIQKDNFANYRKDQRFYWKRILLIKPNYRSSGWDYYNMDFPPINLTYIASYLSDLDVQVKILDSKVNDLNLKQEKKEI